MNEILFQNCFIFEQKKIDSYVNRFTAVVVSSNTPFFSTEYFELKNNNRIVLVYDEKITIKRRMCSWNLEKISKCY